MDKWQEFEEIEKYKKPKSRQSKAQIKGKFLSLKKKTNWLNGIASYSKDSGLHYIRYNRKKAFNRIKQHVYYSKSKLINFEDEREIHVLSSDNISQAQRSLNKQISILKSSGLLDTESQKNTQQLLEKLDFAKFLINQDLISIDELEKEIQEPETTDLKKLLPWLEVELNTDFRLNISPCSFIIKYKHLFIKQLSRAFDLKKYSKRLDLFILALLDREDINHPESEQIKQLSKLINSELIPEIIYLSQLPDFNLKTAKTICLIIQDFEIVRDFYKLLKPYFKNITDIEELLIIISPYIAWLNGISYILRNFIFNFLRFLFISFDSIELIKKFLDLIYQISTMELENNSEDKAIRLALTIKMLTLLLNISTIFLVKQNEKQLDFDLDIAFSYIIEISQHIYKLQIPEGRNTPAFKDNFVHYDLLAIFNFLLERPQKLSEEVVKEIFETTYKTGYHDSFTIFPAWVAITKLGTSQTRKFIDILKTLQPVKINYENIFDIFACDPMVIELDIIDYLVNMRFRLGEKKFDYILSELYLTTYFEKEVELNTRHRLILLDWYEKNIDYILKNEDSWLIDFFTQIYYVIYLEEDVISYFNRLKDNNIEKPLEHIYLSAAVNALKIAYVSEKYSNISFIQVFKLLINQLELRNSLENISKIYSNDKILAALFNYYDTDIIETYAKQYFFQMKELSFIPEKDIMTMFEECRKISEEAKESDLSTIKDTASVIQLYPGSVEIIKELFAFQTKNNKPSELPKKLLKKVLYSHSINKELEHLQQIRNKNDKLLKRIENLKKYKLQNKQYPESKFINRLIHHLNVEKFYYMKSKIHDYFAFKFNKVFGYIPEEGINDDYRNALLMYHGTKYNRNLLKRLVDGCKEDIYKWKSAHPLNKSYAVKLKNKNVDMAKWSEGYRKRYDRISNNIPYLNIYTEQNPLKVLHMGNYFNTCLSAGGTFSYSAIAIACEINKHVIFAEDHNEEIIARQLIALTNEGNLVTYDIYNRSNIEIEPLFLAFVSEFTNYCNAGLDKKGIVEAIITPHWYDDGVTWYPGLFDIEDLPPQRKTSGEKPFNKYLSKLITKLCKY